MTYMYLLANNCFEITVTVYFGYYPLPSNSCVSVRCCTIKCGEKLFLIGFIYFRYVQAY